ncbi:MAG: energy-coupling factor ABC transporter permease [Firmicutes bacterium]|nr:energy-coupling factor ABC transporter permease [Bacillota bacterium]MCL5038675.1 energy-coupling factor ABC transporter permease [Bacillota bacterium]
MHIPDGFLDTKTWVALAAVSGVSVARAVRKTNQKLGEKQVPLMGVLAAFVFAAQMLNFPVAGGTSGHFMGALLIAVLLGPASSILIMTVILTLQAVIFQDGGILALGANIFNMGLVGGAGGYGVFLLLRRWLGENRRLLATGAAAWLAIVMAAAAAALELAFSRTVPLNIVLPAMLGVHALIGIGEALVSMAVISLLERVRPDLLELEKI